MADYKWDVRQITNGGSFDKYKNVLKSLLNIM